MKNSVSIILAFVVLCAVIEENGLGYCQMPAPGADPFSQMAQQMMQQGQQMMQQGMQMMQQGMSAMGQGMPGMPGMGRKRR